MTLKYYEVCSSTLVRYTQNQENEKTKGQMIHGEGSNYTVRFFIHLKDKDKKMNPITKGQDWYYDVFCTKIRKNTVSS